MTHAVDETLEAMWAYGTEHNARPGAMHITLAFAARLSDEAAPEGSATDESIIGLLEDRGNTATAARLRDDNARHDERMEWIRTTLSRVGAAGYLWGVPLFVHEDGPTDVWCTAEEPPMDDD